MGKAGFNPFYIGPSSFIMLFEYVRAKTTSTQSLIRWTQRGKEMNNYRYRICEDCCYVYPVESSILIQFLDLNMPAPKTIRSNAVKAVFYN